MGDSFTHKEFRRAWASIDVDTKRAIRDKAAWEHMTLSAVIREWWPDVWTMIQEATDA